jgi:hypothetical protein
VEQPPMIFELYFLWERRKTERLGEKLNRNCSMKTKLHHLFIALLLFAGVNRAAAQGTAFTYQGQLQANGSPASGTYNLTFTLFNTNITGVPIAGPVMTNGVIATNGLFTVQIDFGSGMFTGTNYWLQIGVETNGASPFMTLTPRQQLTPVPYAIFAESSSNLLGSLPVAQLSGTVPLAQLPAAVVTNNETSVTLSNVTLTGTLNLPSAGTINAGGSSLLFADSADDFYAGPGAGSVAISATDSTGIGYGSLSSNSNGVNNTAIGYLSLNNNTNGSFNVASGGRALFSNTSGNNNAAYGRRALEDNTSGSDNTAVGFEALDANPGGSNNIALGYLAGSGFGNNEISNIDIGNPGLGGDNNIIRIGSGQTSAFIAGVINGNGGGLTNLNASQLGGLAASSFWQTTGNAGTTPGVNFLGTSDNEPLIFRADDQVSLQLQYNSVTSGSFPFLLTQSSINLIGGYWNNTISSGVVGGTIAGGGGASRLGVNNYNSPNSVTASFGTVGGGVDNTAGNYATVPGGDANVASGLYSFAAGQQAQALHQGAFVWADSESPVFASTGNDQFLIRAQGGVGIGTASPEQALSVNGGLNLDQAGLNAGFVNNGNTNGHGLTFGISSGEGIASDRVSGVNQYGLDFYTDFAHRMSILQHGNVGIGTTNPLSQLEVNGDVRIDGNNLYLEPGGGGSFEYDGLTWGDPGLGGINNGGQGPWLAGFEGGALGALNPNVVCLSWDASGDVDVAKMLTVSGEYLEVAGLTPVDCYLGDDGSGNDVQIGSLKSGVTAVSCYNEADQAYMHLYVSSITIKGGSDLAEPFKITSGKGDVPQGAVVVIDEQNPGHLKLSDQSYDTHVAGVVSGANGINPGIQMEQQGLLDGGENVALTGRVYVQADVSNGAIKPGDLLTTSRNPGRAMKVTDHARAAGAILGKAMTGLSKGQGMVLVLVTLQ